MSAVRYNLPPLPDSSIHDIDTAVNYLCALHTKQGGEEGRGEGAMERKATIIMLCSDHGLPAGMRDTTAARQRELRNTPLPTSLRTF